MVQCDRLEEGEDDQMVMLDGTKILTEIAVINGLIMYVYIICVVFCCYVIKLTGLKCTYNT